MAFVEQEVAPAIVVTAQSEHKSGRVFASIFHGNRRTRAGRTCRRAARPARRQDPDADQLDSGMRASVFSARRRTGCQWPTPMAAMRIDIDG
jgi:hypothetical protein